METAGRVVSELISGGDGLESESTDPMNARTMIIYNIAIISVFIISE
jgi:hypothetical protein